MTDAFLHLSDRDRREALAQAQNDSGRPFYLLEKDVWVVWCLEQLCGAPFGRDLVFKGGTSLSKAHKVITRFSEDVDLTYSITAIAGDLTGKAGSAYPPTVSQEKKWTKTIRARLQGWVRDVAGPHLQSAVASIGAPATVDINGDQLLLGYEALAERSAYVRPTVRLEFGARSTGDPHEPVPITCDAAAFLPDVAFPSATPEVMRPERTFWEKATAIHVFCLQGRARGGERFSRHWHDVTRLDRAGFVEAAIAERALAGDVARHKTMFFAEKDRHGVTIDYRRAVSGGLQLVPTDSECMDVLRDDYARMLDEGLLADDTERFDELMDECRRIEGVVNAAARTDTH